MSEKLTFDSKFGVAPVNQWESYKRNFPQDKRAARIVLSKMVLQYGGNLNAMSAAVSGCTGAGNARFMDILTYLGVSFQGFREECYKAKHKYRLPVPYPFG